MSKFMKSTVAAVFTASLLASSAAFAQSAASTGATDNAAAQKENYKVRDQQGAGSSGKSSMNSPAPASSTGATANSASQNENYKVRQKQAGGSKKKSKPMHSSDKTGGAPVPGTSTRN